MSTSKRFFVVALALALTVLPASAFTEAEDEPAATQQQQQYGPLERGWRTGYSDGYQAGWQDSLARRAADFRANEEYRRADRAYVSAYGALEDYRDGYRQGFEIGYGEGFARRGFNSELPAGGVQRRGISDDETTATQPTRTSGARRDDEDDAGMRPTRGAGTASVPANIVMRVELLNRLSTDVSQRDDRFEARVIEPQEFEGAMVAGRVVSVERAGKVRGRAQIQLSFDQIRLEGGEWMEFSAQVIEIVPMGGDDESGEVDPEGGVRGRSTKKDDVAKVGAASGIGAIIGAIAGGGKGAAIGAVIGAGVGTGGVLTQRGRDIRFEPGQQLRIRTSREARVQ